MVNYKDLLKVGDYVVAISDCYMDDSGEVFAIEGNKYEVIKMIETTTWEQECFMIIDEVGHEHRFPYCYLDPNHENYLYDVVRLSRAEKIKSLYEE